MFLNSNAPLEIYLYSMIKIKSPIGNNFDEILQSLKFERKFIRIIFQNNRNKSIKHSYSTYLYYVPIII